MNNPLLIISYFCGIRGNCPAEWADDKIRVMEKAGRNVIVLAGMGSHVTHRPGIRYVRVPSLSWNDYKIEVNELRQAGETVPLALWAFALITFPLGSVFDYVLRKVTNGISAGRWSWTLTAFPVALWLRIRYSARDIFCTGGPTAAHVVGGWVTALSGAKLYCEFQDPILGAMMNRSSRTRRISLAIEAWLARIAQKVVYVTKEAARLAQERHPDHTPRISAIYPGAWQFVSESESENAQHCEAFEFLHLGTLYGSRNLDAFFDALDALRAEGFAPAHSVRVVNLGAVYCDTAPNYLARSDFRSLAALERVAALRRAQKSSCMLLVQHTDERSRETIPYKTYDYLNLRKPVLGLLNNNELSALIASNGGFPAQAGDVPSIKRALHACLLALSDRERQPPDRYQHLDISRQFQKIFE